MLVIKVGGAQGINYDAVCADLAELLQQKQTAVLVHGGSEETNILSEKLGKPPRILTAASGYTSRYTDRETLEIFEMVYCGKINKMIVEKLQRLGVNAVGLSGIDGRLWEGTRKSSITIVEKGKRKIVRDDYTGRVEKVNTPLIRLLLDNGYVPVLTPPAISYEGEAINVDGDRAAAILAASLQAETLVILSNVPGLLRDVADETSLIPSIPLKEIEHFAEFALGRMKKKVLGAKEALQNGVQRVVFADARVEHPIRAALAGHGTVIE
ncbi:MAG: [LysW]-aminoadipate kinase [Acidobacteriia bacterium]|nr:[LysW]-aminoadipate kinase [Terriglobia bacterium]